MSYKKARFYVDNNETTVEYVTNMLKTSLKGQVFELHNINANKVFKILKDLKVKKVEFD